MSNNNFDKQTYSSSPFRTDDFSLHSVPTSNTPQENHNNTNIQIDPSSHEQDYTQLDPDDENNAPPSTPQNYSLLKPSHDSWHGGIHPLLADVGNIYGKSTPEDEDPTKDWTFLERLKWFFGFDGPVSIWSVLFMLSRIIVFLGLFIFPWFIYDLETIKKIWWIPLAGIAACSIPSGGAPVAGGILFLPLLTLSGVVATDAVCFSAATQMIGVGILVPATWLVAEPAVFIPSVFFFALIPGTITTLLVLFFLPLQGASGDFTTQMIFGLFCFAVAIHTSWGLWKGNLHTQAEPVIWGPGLFIVMMITCISGGFLVAYIGIGIEKIMFVALTWYCKADARRVGITSVTVTGIISGAAFVFHIFNNHSCVVSILPYWVMCLWGVFLGAAFGPRINAALGPKRILIVFVIFLLAEAVRDAVLFVQYAKSGEYRGDHFSWLGLH